MYIVDSLFPLTSCMLEVSETFCLSRRLSVSTILITIAYLLWLFFGR